MAKQSTSIIPPSLSSVAYIVAVLVDIGVAKPIGYRIAAISGLKGEIDVRDVPYDTVKQMLLQGARLENAELDKNLEVHITQGSYKAYPKVDAATSAIRGRNGLTVIYGVVDDQNNVIGYGVVDSSGTIGNVSLNRLLHLANMYLQTNWEVYAKDAGDRRIRLKTGELQRVSIKRKTVVQSYTSGMESEAEVEAKKQANEAALEQIKKDEVAKQAAISSALSAEAKSAEKLAEGEAFKRYDATLKALDNFNDALSQGTFTGNIDSERERLNSEIADALKEYQLKCQEARNSLVHDSEAATALPALSISGLVDSSIHPNVAKTANTKMVQIANNLNLVSPYYASMYTAIPKIFSMTLPTMAVTEKEMLINPSFLMQLPIGEATFVYIHEMLHIAMQHAARHGKRDNFLWNVACDIYINELICRDFGIRYGDTQEKVFNVQGSNGKQYRGVLKCPENGCFLSTVGETLDFSKDTAESIYRRLYEENKDTMQQSSGQGGSGQQGGAGQQSQSNQQGGAGQQPQSGEQQGQGGSQGSSGQPQEQQTGAGQQSQGVQQQQGAEQQAQGSQGSSDQHQSGGNGQGIGQNASQSQGGDGSNTQSPSNSSTDSQQGSNPSNQSQGNTGDWGSAGKSATGSSSLQDDIANSNIEDYRVETVSRELVYKGKKLSVTVNMDIVSDEKVANSERPKEEAWDAAREAITRVITKRKLDASSGKKSFSLTSGEELVERSMDFALAAQRDWRTILRHMANKKPKKTYTLTSPDRKLMNMGITVASRQPIGKKSAVSGLKICVDVSGSVGEEELNRVFTVIAQILNEYNVEAEMIYWDTQITNVGTFTDLKGMLKIKPLGSGGTDVRCVFDYLMKRTKFKGVTEETSIKEIPCVLIFTDGCFSENYVDYARYFAKKVVWVIDEGSPPFKPIFGVVAKEKLK